MKIAWFSALTLLLAVNAAVGVFLLFFETDQLSPRLVWLRRVTLLPVVGLVLYVVFSGRFFTRTRRFRRAAASRFDYFDFVKQEQLEFLERRKTLYAHSAVQRFFPLVFLNLAGGRNVLAATERIDVQTSGAAHFASLFGDIAAAKSSVNLEYFIFRSDATGTRLMDLLCRKAREGVSVRLIYDDVGSIFTPRAFFARLQKAGGEVAAFLPVRGCLPVHLNYRNHRKIAVIDGKIAYIGGHNIGDEYAGLTPMRRLRNIGRWRDTQARFTGTSVALAQALFLTDWSSVAASGDSSPEELARYFSHAGSFKRGADEQNEALFARVFDKGAIPTQIVAAGPDDAHGSGMEDLFIKLIASAARYVYIQTPYFVPTKAISETLKVAAASGVDVRVMLPERWDKFYVKAASYSFVRELLTFGIRFFHYQGFIHAKTVVVDDAVTSIGSTNLDPRSFSLHYEVSALFYDAGVAVHNRGIFLADERQCREAQREAYERCFFAVRAWRGFFRLFSALL